MTQQQYVINRKLNILELGEKLGNISQACKRLGVSRQHYYDIKAAVEEDGIEGLLEKSRKKPRIGNRVPEEFENAVLDYSLEYPTHGQTTVSNELKQKGIVISPGGVRSIWLRHKLEKKHLRLKRLEEHSAKSGIVLTESQVQALEDAKEEKKAHGEIETHHPGYLLGQDTFYVGYIKGVGRIYQQTAIDTFSNFGFAKLYLDKSALTSADILNDRVLPFFDEEGMSLLRTLTDNGLEYCGRTDSHPYQLFLHLNDIEHTRTKVRHPQTNGCTEKLNQTIKNEFYAVAFRKKLYKTLEEMQTDLDEFMQRYNYKRTNQGKNCAGRTPAQTLEAGYKLYKKYVIDGMEVTEKSENTN
ncbi:MAG: IS481 family transposase [Bdellovibrionales bacterium]|nr:IS481 family transposase [Bdellovibrionales bacterium]